MTVIEFRPRAARRTGASQLRLGELMASLSYALDLTEGQPEGHCLRCAWIGLQIGRELGLPQRVLWDLYYTLLLKDLGCSSNAARVCELYLADDLSFKHDFKTTGTSLPSLLGFVLSHTGRNARWAERFKAIVGVLRGGQDIAHELILTRCTRGATIARRMRFNERIAAAIHSLDEHWDGGGQPAGLRGDEIPLGSRIALLAQVIDVFQFSAGADAAMTEVRRRCGTWFDPALCAAAERVAADPRFWSTLASVRLEAEVLNLEPAQFSVPLDDDYLDDIAEAFGEVVDSKSPFTAGHSKRVGLFTDEIAAQLGVGVQRRRWLHRAALLHDVGKLGVSNRILDKPGRLDADEWEAVKRHAGYTETILARSGAFRDMAQLAGAHHEKLDGSGYPRGLKDGAISLETRIITTADIFDAINAERPYHPATPVDQTLDIMAQMVGTTLDPRCFEALREVVRLRRED